MKKDTFYFSHDYNASSDTKVLFLRQQLGMEGYGIYWYLIEALAQAGGTLPFKIVPVLAMQMQVTEIKVKAVIDQFELFKIFEDGFYSDRLNKHLQIRKTLSLKGAEGANLRWNKLIDSPPIAPPNGEAYAKERKGKERKGKEKKVNKFIPPNIEDVKSYCLERQNNVDAQKWMDHYISNGWRVGRNPMSDWKAAVRTWEKNNFDTAPKKYESLADKYKPKNLQ